MAPLREASDRLQTLSRAGLTQERRAQLLAKSVAELESILTNPEIDPFARIAAAKTIIRDIAGVQPSKTTASVHGSQAPVVINIGDMPPAPGRAARNVTPKASGSQVPVVIDGLPSHD